MFLKNSIIYGILALLAGTTVFAMDLSSVHPTALVPAAGAFAVARYGSPIVQAALPENLFAQTVVPPALKWGGYAVTGHFVLQSCGMRYTDLLKKEPRRRCYFVAPALVAYNADAASVYLASYAGNSPAKPDYQSLLRHGLYWGGIGAAVYLFATQTLDLATQRYLKNKMRQLGASLQGLSAQVAAFTQTIAHTRAQTAELRTNEEARAARLQAASRESKQHHQQATAALTALTTAHRQSQIAVNELRAKAQDLLQQTTSIEWVTKEIAGHLTRLRENHRAQLSALMAQLQKDKTGLLTKITANDKTISVQMDQLELECKNQTTDRESLQGRLGQLLELLGQQNQTFSLNDVQLDQIRQTISDLTAVVDGLIVRMGALRDQQTPG